MILAFYCFCCHTTATTSILLKVLVNNWTTTASVGILLLLLAHIFFIRRALPRHFRETRGHQRNFNVNRCDIFMKSKTMNALFGVKSKCLNIWTGHSIFPTVGQEGQLMQLFFTWSSSRLEALEDSGWYLLSGIIVWNTHLSKLTLDSKHTKKCVQCASSGHFRL